MTMPFPTGSMGSVKQRTYSGRLHFKVPAVVLFCCLELVADCEEVRRFYFAQLYITTMPPPEYFLRLYPMPT
jgi:hypothetical protein